MPEEVKTAKLAELAQLQEKKLAGQRAHKDKLTAAKKIYKQIKFVGINFLWVVGPRIFVFLEMSKVTRKITRLRKAIAGTYNQEEKAASIREELEQWQEHLLYIKVTSDAVVFCSV